MIAVITVFCVCLGLYIEPVVRQQSSVRKIRSLGGTVSYDRDHGNYLQAWTPSWLQERVGEDFFLEVASVRIDSREVRDISMLGNLVGLKEIVIELADARTTDLSPVCKISGLQRLHISGTSFGDLTALKNLTELEHLSLWSIYADNLDALANLRKLKSLEISGDQITSLQPLARLSNLQSLEFVGDGIDDVSPIASLSNLKRLRLSGKSIKDISPLAQLGKLQYVSIKHTNVSDLSAFQSCNRLKTIDFSHTPVTDILPLRNNHNLKTVNLTHTKVTDLRPLAGLDLDFLYVGNGPTSAGLRLVGKGIRDATSGRAAKSVQD